MNRQGQVLFEAPLAHEAVQHAATCLCRECRTAHAFEIETARWEASGSAMPKCPGPRVARTACPPPQGLSPAEFTALAITSRFETGRPFGCAVSSVDGISLGMIQWNLQAGTLQTLLKRFEQRTNRLQAFFGAETDSLRDLINLPRNPMIKVKGKYRTPAAVRALRECLAARWEKPLLQLCTDPDYCRIMQESLLHDYMRKAHQATIRLGLQAVRGLAMMFDIAVGDGYGKRDTKLDAFEAALGSQMSEQEKLRVIARLAAEMSGDQKADRLPRRLLIANGTGVYRGSTNWNLDRDFPNLNDPWNNARPIPNPLPTPSPPPTPPSGRPLLRYGSRGPSVRELQVSLNRWLVRRPQLGLPPLVVDGIFGPLTRKTVRTFQQVEGLRVDGIVGPQTWGRLLRSRPSPVPPAPQPTPQPQGSGYPRLSRFVPAKYFKPLARPRQINRIVIHITDGTTTDGTVSWFKNMLGSDGRPAVDKKGRPIRVSAHYVVGQDGEVVQMVRDNDIAWHADNANADSIGIEHVARPRNPRLVPSQAQYCSSADLVRWLCHTYNIPIDRIHIVGHSEVDVYTDHQDCPNSVWDWTRYMNMVTGATPC